MNRLFLIGAAATLLACGTDDTTPSDGAGGAGGSGITEPQGLPVLGRYQHTISSVAVTLIGDVNNQLDVPRDLEFNPLNPAELWVVNRGDDAVVVFTNPGTPQQQHLRQSGPGAEHFLVQPSALAMSSAGYFATSHETDEQTQGPNGTPADFMGPALWKADLSTFDGGNASHYDMLHNSPNGMGVAWQHDNVYWVFDGFHAAITMYDFRGDHGPAGADHSDGIVKRYVEGGVLWVENVPSHMQFDPPGGNMLYVADTGNSRVAMLDTLSGTQGSVVTPNYDGSDQTRVDNATLTTLVNGFELQPQMLAPSGLAIFDGHLFVSDNATSIIFAFDMQGQLLDWLETGLPPGSLMGLTFDVSGQLFVADGLGQTVLRISALAEPP